MAVAGILPAIAGLQRLPTSQDLELSRAVYVFHLLVYKTRALTCLFFRYNSLPHPEEQPEISDASLKALGELFVRHGVQDAFGIHLLHSHFIAPEGTVLLGTEAQ